MDGILIMGARSSKHMIEKRSTHAPISEDIRSKLVAIATIDMEAYIGAR